MLRDPDWVSKITHLDQDVLNVLLNGKVKFISRNIIPDIVLTMN